MNETTDANFGVHVGEHGGPLSHPVNVLKLPSKGTVIKIRPDTETLAALAAYLGVLAVSHLSSALTVRKWHKDGVRVSGPIEAQLTQECVVTLQPVEEIINTEIDAVFVPEQSKLSRPVTRGEAGEMLIDPEGDDAPEVFAPPNLDIGAVATEFLALEMDPYPKAEGAEVGDGVPALTNSEDDDGRENPFAALAGLKDKL